MGPCGNVVVRERLGYERSESEVRIRLSVAIFFLISIIATLSITGQTFLKCRKNGSDRLRKGNFSATLCVGGVCCWFSPLLRNVFFWVHWFFPSPQTSTLPDSNSFWNERTRLNEFLTTPKCFRGRLVPSRYLYVFGMREDWG